MKLNRDLIQYIGLFEKITRTRVKNCFFQGECLVFVVGLGQKSKAIGRGATNAKRISALIKKRVKIVEHNSDPVKFINGYIYPVEAETVRNDNGSVEIKVKSLKDKGLLIGRNRKNLDDLKSVVDYYFKIKDIKIV
jgi:transcription termination/antitermination protein NusA